MEKFLFIVGVVLMFLVPGAIFAQQYSGPKYPQEVLGRSLYWLVLVILKPIISSLEIWHRLTGKGRINF